MPLETIRKAVKEKLGIRASVFDKRLEDYKRKEYSNGDIKPLRGDHIVLSPSLDFNGNVGIVAVSCPIIVEEKVRQKFILVTSDRKRHILEDHTSSIDVEGKKVILKERQMITDANIRWAWKDIQSYLNGSNVNPLTVFQSTEDLLLSYLEWQNPTTPKILALWIMGTYLYPLFDAYPYINLIGPKGSGKTKALDVLIRQAFNGRMTANISTAALFRITEATGATLGIDEAERLKNRNATSSQDLRLLLNAGYRKGSPAIRCEGEDNTPKAYEVYSPKIIAGIDGVDDVLESRCIVINMLRAKPGNPVGRIVVSDRTEDWIAIRNQFYVFALTYFEKISNTYHNDAIVGSLNNRAAELWRPLLSNAKVIDPDDMIGLYELVYEQGLKYTKEAEIAEIDDDRAAVIRVLIEITSDGTDELRPIVVSDKLTSKVADPTKSPFSPQGVGYHMKDLGLRRARIKEGSVYHCSHEQAIDLAERYGIDYQ